MATEFPRNGFTSRVPPPDMAQAMAHGQSTEEATLHETVKPEAPQTITAADLDVDDDYEPELSVDLGDLPPVLDAQAEEVTLRQRALNVVRAYNKKVAGWDSMEQLPEPDADMGIMGTVRLVGGAVVGIAVITLVVNQVLSIQSIANSTGPFSGVITSLESTGVAAMTLLVVGLVVAAASAIMSFMGSGF